MTRSLSRFVLTTATLGAASLALHATAQADIISIGLGLNGGPVTFETSGSGVAGVIAGLDGFNVNVVTGTGNPPLPGSALLDTTSTNVTSGETTNLLDVYVTESDITSPTGNVSFGSGFTENTITKGWSVTESLYLDGADGVFTTPLLLGTATFTSLGATGGSSAAITGAGPYSITALYVVDTNDIAGQANSTINASVPEPATLALFAAGLLGCALGIRRRRHS